VSDMWNFIDAVGRVLSGGTWRLATLLES